MPLGEAFGTATAATPDHPARQRQKKPAPFSLRLSPDERARLALEAAGAPLGSYIRAKLLGTAPVRSRKTGIAVEDRQSLGKVLALLGQSRLSSNLNQLAHLAHIGALPVTPELEAQLSSCVAEIRDLRRLLLAALGLKPEAQP